MVGTDVEVICLFCRQMVLTVVAPYGVEVMVDHLIEVVDDFDDVWLEPCEGSGRSPR